MCESEVAGANAFENQCYGNLVANAVENEKESKRDSPTADMWSMRKQTKSTLVIMTVLAVVLIGACAALVGTFAEISKLSRNQAETNSIIAAITANFTNIEMLQSAISQTNHMNMKNLVILNETLQQNTISETAISETAISKISETNMNVKNLNETLQQLLVYSSCVDVLQRLPSSPSGYYWIKSRDGSAVNMYCDMTRSCGGIVGGWIRVAKLDMTDSATQCPDNLALTTTSPRTCESITLGVGCTPTIYSVNSVQYSKVCGKIRAYQYGTLDAFGRRDPGIDGNYVDGVSLTHGSSPRKHIWTFTASIKEDSTNRRNKCPCISGGTSHPPAYVGNDYFCDSAFARGFFLSYHLDDPLWDGAGCGSTNMCCSFNNPPWFYKQLPQSTTDDIEMRMCRDEVGGSENIAVQSVEIFVRE